MVPIKIDLMPKLPPAIKLSKHMVLESRVTVLLYKANGDNTVHSVGSDAFGCFELLKLELLATQLLCFVSVQKTLTNSFTGVKQEVN